MYLPTLFGEQSTITSTHSMQTGFTYFLAGADYNTKCCQLIFNLNVSDKEFQGVLLLA